MAIASTHEPAARRRRLSGRRLRLLVLSAVIAALGLGGSLPGGSLPASAALDDFTFDSFHADYTLERDELGVSELSVVETLVARFPGHDQNRGVQRALVRKYDGRDTRISVTSVTDETGSPREFWIEQEDDFVLVNMAGQD